MITEQQVREFFDEAPLPGAAWMAAIAQIIVDCRKRYETAADTPSPKRGRPKGSRNKKKDSPDPVSTEQSA